MLPKCVVLIPNLIYPIDDIEFPIYLDKDIVQHLNEKCQTTQESLQSLVNGLLRKDIEIAKKDRVLFIG